MAQGDTEETKAHQTGHVRGHGRQSMPEDVQRFLTICEQGKLYPMMMDGMGWQGSRQAFKDDVWFAFLYGSNKSDQKLADPEKVDLRRLTEFFRSEFPNVYGYMWAKKERNYKRLSWDMQRAESKLMIDEVCFRLADEYPHVPVLSIHDSILTTPTNVVLVTSLITKAFATLGIRPTLGLEDYTEKERRCA